MQINNYSTNLSNNQIGFSAVKINQKSLNGFDHGYLKSFSAELKKAFPELQEKSKGIDVEIARGYHTTPIKGADEGVNYHYCPMIITTVSKLIKKVLGFPIKVTAQTRVFIKNKEGVTAEGITAEDILKAATEGRKLAREKRHMNFDYKYGMKELRQLKKING